MVRIVTIILAAKDARGQLVTAAKEKPGPHGPRDIMIVEEFPRTTAGKVIKRDLAAIYRAAIKDRRRN